MSVYYVHAPAVDLVKIGFAADPRSRLGKIRVDCPVPVVLLATEDGDTATEASRHTRFAHLRVRGEWFRMADDLQAHVASLTPYASPSRDSLNKQIAALGISPSYASMIVSGKQAPSRPLAIHILRTTGWRHSLIADLTDEQLATLEQIEPWAPRSSPHQNAA